MKTLIIYYSLDWNTKFISETIAKEFDWEILELKTTKELINKNSFMKYLWWWKMVYMKEEPELESINVDFDKYDLIIIGTPVWAFNYTPPIATFFSNHKLIGKKIAIFCCHGWWMWKTLTNMREKLTWNNLISENNFIEPLRRDMEVNVLKLKQWITDIKSKFQENS